LAEEVGLYEVSNETLLDAALDHAEQINTITDPESDPIEVWLSKDGYLTVDIPNELSIYAKNEHAQNKKAELDDDKRIKDCGFCHQKAIYRKNEKGNWCCEECGQPEPHSVSNELVQPFVRSLPYGTSDGTNRESNASLRKRLTTAQNGIMWKNRRNPRKLKRILDNVVPDEDQEDIENSATDLALEE